jgi:hypothetical protein
MPYLNKRNRFIDASKNYADENNIPYNGFTKANLLTVAQSINMKGIPTWVLKECNSPAKGLYDLTHLYRSLTTTV